MRKCLGLSRWLSSLLLVHCATVFAVDELILSPDDLYKPEVVGSWLKANGAKADKARANLFYAHGMKEKARKAWGPAGKGFGDAALRYPTPEALIESAEAELRMLGEIRARNGDRKTHVKSDLSSARSLYLSALEADRILNPLSVNDKQRIRANAECVAAYLRTAKATPGCEPLTLYGIKQKS